MLAAGVTTPVPSRSSDPSNHKREKLPTVLACLRYWLWELGKTEKKVAKTLFNGCRIQIFLYLLLEPVMSGSLYSIVYRICTI